MELNHRKKDTIVDTLLFEIKGILEKEDACRSEGGGKLSILWKAIKSKMEQHKDRNKDYKYILDMMDDLDAFYDKIGIDGFK